VFVSYVCPNVQAFARSTGVSLWSYLPGCSGGGGATAAYNNQRLFVRDTSQANGPQGYIFDAPSGALLGRYEAGPIPALANGQSFVLAAGVLRATDLNMGPPTWTFAGDGTLSSTPLVVGHQVYVGGTSGNLYALDVTTSQEEWTANVGTSIPASREGVGLNEGEGLLVVPAGSSLVAYANATPTPTATPTATPSLSPSDTATATPTLTATPTAAATVTPSPSPSASATPTASAGAVATLLAEPVRLVDTRTTPGGQLGLARRAASRSLAQVALRVMRVRCC
jgi:hypothetical protein